MICKIVCEGSSSLVREDAVRDHRIHDRRGRCHINTVPCCLLYCVGIAAAEDAATMLTDSDRFGFSAVSRPQAQHDVARQAELIQIEIVDFGDPKMTAKKTRVGKPSNETLGEFDPPDMCEHRCTATEEFGQNRNRANRGEID
jgi:hypothetical protein